jgi:DNA polymerase-3 subunit alpha
MDKRVTPKPSDYVHLHNHTQYSLLDGLTKVPALVERIKEMGMGAVAMTDHGTMSGIIEFYKAANGAGIKPILGMEAYIAPRKHTDKDVALDRQYFHLTMLAMNNAGYLNLMKLSSIASLDGFYYKPRIDKQLLERYNEGIIILSGCIGGEVSDLLRQEQYKQAFEAAKWYKRVFGDRYYIELQDHGHPDHPTAWDEQDKVNNQLLKIAQELDIPAVVTCDAHYLNHEDQEAHEVLLCVQTGAFLSDENRFSLKDFELHVADPKEIIKRWGKHHPQLITNTKLIAERCDVSIELGKILIPTFPTPKGETEKSLLEQYVWKGLSWRYGGKTRQQAFADSFSVAAAKKTLPPKVIERAAYELSVVDSMGFNGYYLIVQDFINWGKDQGIVFGPGRGSAASSIMAYALRITELDALAYNLLFERFLNPGRISMPDMDIDIQDSRRDEVINYCVEKYGRDRVANIVTFGRMAARNSVRDVARVLQVPYAEADRLAKMIPPPLQGRHIPLSSSLEKNVELKNEYQSSQSSKRVFDLATQLEGTIRSHGVHAAGVVIAPSEIASFAPLELAQKGVQATQYSMGPIEELGLLKIDFLGLSNLTTIKNTLRIIKKVYGRDIDIDALPLDDEPTFELLRRGETIGVFQLESAGMTRFSKELKPNQFDDIIAMVALYRPGPMAEFPKFIEGKNNAASISFPHPSLEPILKETYGVIVFQEQIIALLQLIAGYSPGEADLVRKAIGKKQRHIMKAEEPRFIAGCLKQGLSKAGAEKLWGLIQPFADYSFNKAHAACYALIAYQTAYLKAHYPDAFMAALMTSDYDNIDRLAIEISACKHMGIEVLPPDINESFHEFSILAGKNQIRFGLDAIKNVGHGAAEELIRAREAAGGKLENLDDFSKQVNCRIVNRKALESLTKAGAFDTVVERGKLIANIDNLLAAAARYQKAAASGQVDLFGVGSSIPIARVELSAPAIVIDVAEQLTWERELLGLYLSHHPLEDYDLYLKENALALSSLNEDMDGLQATLGGAIEDVREITTKNGSKMAFVRLVDLSGEIEVVVFPKMMEDAKSALVRDAVVLATGRLDFSRGSAKIVADDVKLISRETALNYTASGKTVEAKPGSRNKFRNTKEKVPTKREAPEDRVHKVYIRLEDSSDQALLMNLKEKLDGYSGSNEVILVTGPKDDKKAIRLPQSIEVNEESIRELAGIFGSTNVVVR